ncbi:MAG TPA: carbamate kinase [Streptosporangiaceae bacterium]|jgi:carbamate kinase|nr:carbamate kinase [Streptosporangiaceae bacterium]
MTKTAVIALGGNAFTLPGMAGSCDELLTSAAAMAACVNEVIEAGWRVLIVHGNGPQVGNLALQQEATRMVPAQPLAVLGAMTQGQLGSIIARSIDRLRGPGSAAALVTHIAVDPADPAFGAPTKPIGPFFERDEAERLAAERGWQVQPDSGRGYRRVVASPRPAAIVEIDAIRALLDGGLLVIAAGGGGIPVIGGPGDRGYADAVIDKDRAARLLATNLGAQALLLVTAVDQVMVDFGTPHQSALVDISAAEAARHLAEGQFPPGSMGPKVEAALEFLADGGEQVVITSPGLLAGTLTGTGDRRGTRIEPSRPRAGRSG